MKTKKNCKKNIWIECEACADHVCNDFCGCELSEAAINSKIKNKDK